MLVLFFVILANKYRITTYINFLIVSHGNFCSIKYKLLWLAELLVILDKLSATKTKDH